MTQLMKLKCDSSIKLSLTELAILISYYLASNYKNIEVSPIKTYND